MAKALKEIKRDYEHALVGLDQAAVAGSASAARKMQSVMLQIRLQKQNCLLRVKLPTLMVVTLTL